MLDKVRLLEHYKTKLAQDYTQLLIEGNDFRLGPHRYRLSKLKPHRLRLSKLRSCKLTPHRLKLSRSEARGGSRTGLTKLYTPL